MGYNNQRNEICLSVNEWYGKKQTAAIQSRRANDIAKPYTSQTLITQRIKRC